MGIVVRPRGEFRNSVGGAQVYYTPRRQQCTRRRRTTVGHHTNRRRRRRHGTTVGTARPPNTTVDATPDRGVQTTHREPLIVGNKNPPSSLPQSPKGHNDIVLLSRRLVPAVTRRTKMFKNTTGENVDDVSPRPVTMSLVNRGGRSNYYCRPFVARSNTGRRNARDFGHHWYAGMRSAARR